jgi:L-ascorbate metabolism protein UlaG (beta-lactamase superfamily)
LITHAHGETWSLNDVLKIVGPQTTLIISPNMTVTYEQHKDQIGVPAIVLEEGESTEMNDVKVEAVHINQNPNHLAANGIVGFIVTIDGIRIYDASDTLFYPEMANIQCDIALYPVFSEVAGDIDQVVQVLDTQAMIFVRTPLSVAQLYVDRYNQEGLPIQFIVPSYGAYNP